MAGKMPCKGLQQVQSEKEMSNCTCSCEEHVSADKDLAGFGFRGGILHSNVSSHHFNPLSADPQGSVKHFGKGREQLYYPPQLPQKEQGEQ